MCVRFFVFLADVILEVMSIVCVCGIAFSCVPTVVQNSLVCVSCRPT